MDVREKLVDLIFDSLCRHIDKSCKLAENIADDLISNGVTVQKWVSVKDRLPEDPEERQGVAIMHAIFAALTLESGEQEHTVVKDILPEVYEKFGIMMAIEEFIARGYMEWDKEKKDEDGFPAINVIVPPDQWDMN